MTTIKAEHQIRMIMALRRAGATFNVGGKWARTGNKRFYAKHYHAAEAIDRNMRKHRSRQLAFMASRTMFAHVKGILSSIDASPARVIAFVKKGRRK